jgi:3-oxoacyl-[acyl-carrier-protein] synthase-1
MSALRTVSLSALGAATSLGGMVQAAAAARAGIVRPSELQGCAHLDEELNEPVPISGHPASWLTEGFEGLGRFAQLGLAALNDLLASCPRIQVERTGFFLALPQYLGQEEEEKGKHEPQAAGGEEDEEEIATPAPVPPRMAAQRLVEYLLAETGLVFPPSAISTLLEERYGTIQALQHAMQALWRRQYNHALVMACDSLTDPWCVERMLRARRIKTTDNPVGFMPGEAGVALLLERPDVVRSRGEKPSAVLFEPLTALEPDSLSRRSHSTGQALAEVITGALDRSGISALPQGRVYLDLNGENHRATEWGLALVRARGQCLIDTWSEEIPAVSFGEIGTASPLLALGLAARAFARGYGQGGHALILTASDHGHRAGMVLKHSLDL